MSKKNCEGFTKREIKVTEKARSSYNMVGRPSAAYFKRMVHGNMLNNSPITVADIKNSHTIFSPGVVYLCGKTVREKTEAVMSNYVAIPEQISEDEDSRTDG